MLSEGCYSLTKYFLFVFNLLFFLLGLLLLSMGLWTVLGQASFFNFGPFSTSPFPVSYLLVIGSSITIFLGFFGCLGALKEVKCMLGVYFLLLTILLASEIVAVVLCFTQNTLIQSKLDEHMLQVFNSNKENQSSLEHFEKVNHIQTEAHCCRWNEETNWPSGKVPCSCFSSSNSTTLNVTASNLTNQNQSSSNSCNCLEPNLLYFQNVTSCHIYSTGCKQAFSKWMHDNKVTLLGVLLAIVVIELSGMILSMCLYKSIVFDYYFLHGLPQLKLDSSK